MAQSGYTPISLYYSTTASAVPVNTNLVNGELAINITDGKLYYKNNSGVVTLLANSASASPVTTFSAGTTGFTPSSATSGAVTLAGTLNVANGGTGLTSLPSGNIPVGNGTSAFTSSSSLNWTGTYLFVGGGTALGGATNPILATTGSANNYVQSYVRNSQAGASSSGDLVAYADNSTDSHGWADLGFTSSVYADSTYTVTGAGEAYLFGSALNSSFTGNLVYATDSTGSANAHQWYVGGFTQAKSAYKMQLSSTALTVPVTGTFPGTSSTLAMSITNIAEPSTVSATAATGTINYDITTQSVLYYTTNASANWTVNFRASSGTTLNTAMTTGQSISVSFLVTQGATAYYNSAVQVDGTTSGVTTKWQGGSAPTSGDASAVDVYNYVIIKTGSATFTVLASVTKFA
jgi:hypothetical protein